MFQLDTDSNMIDTIVKCVEILQLLYEIKNELEENWKIFVRLCSRAEIFQSVLQKLSTKANLSLEEVQALEQLHSTLVEILELAKNFPKKSVTGAISRLIFRKAHWAELKSLNDRLNECALNLNVVSSINHEENRKEDMHDVRQFFECGVERILNEIASNQLNETAKEEQLEELQKDIEGVWSTIQHVRSDVGELNEFVLDLLDTTQQRHKEILSNLQNIHEDVQNVGKDVQLILNILQGTTSSSNKEEEAKTREKMLRELRIPAGDLTTTNTVIGQGGFGHVLLGLLRHTTQVAVKCIKGNDSNGSNSAKKDFTEVENELLVMKYIGSYPTILTCYGFILDRTNNQMKVILELAPYGSLNMIVYNKTTFPVLPITLLLAWGCDMINAIYFIHTKFIKHRDIKAENFLVFSQFRIKLCDFGLAKEHHSYSNVSSTSGTLPFMAPEVRQGKGSEYSSDIYSFAMTMLQVCTRKPPRIDNAMGQMKGCLSGMEEKILSFDKFETLLLDCLQYTENIHPNQLRPTASEVHRRLVMILQENGNDPRMFGSSSFPTVRQMERLAEDLRDSKLLTMNHHSNTNTNTISISNTTTKTSAAATSSHLDMSVPLKDLTVDQVRQLLQYLDCTADSNTNEITGEILSLIETSDDCIDIGILMKPIFLRKLVKRLQELQQTGVPLSLLGAQANSLPIPPVPPVSHHPIPALEEVSPSPAPTTTEVLGWSMKQLYKRVLKEGASVLYLLEAAAMEKKDPFAQAYLSQLLTTGAEGISMNKLRANMLANEAWKQLRNLEEQGTVVTSGILYYLIGTLYESGRGVPGGAHIDTAIIYYTKAMVLDDDDAYTWMGRFYWLGNESLGQMKNPQESIRLYQLAADQGHEQAISYLQEIACAGDVNVQFELGKRYEEGIGIVCNDELAMKYYSLLAATAVTVFAKKLNHQEDDSTIALVKRAQYRLAGLKKKHNDVDFAAYLWYRLSSQNSTDFADSLKQLTDLCHCYPSMDGGVLGSACFYRAFLYERAGSLAEAYQYYKNATNAQYLDAYNNIGVLLLTKKNELSFRPNPVEEGMECLLTAAQAGHLLAQYNVGIQYRGKFLENRTTTENNMKAKQWLEDAAKQAFPFAYHQLGLMAHESANHEQALKYFELALENAKKTMDCQQKQQIVTLPNHDELEKLPENNENSDMKELVDLATKHLLWIKQILAIIISIQNYRKGLSEKPQPCRPGVQLQNTSGQWNMHYDCCSVHTRPPGARDLSFGRYHNGATECHWSRQYTAIWESTMSGATTALQNAVTKYASMVGLDSRQVFVVPYFQDPCVSQLLSDLQTKATKFPETAFQVPQLQTWKDDYSSHFINI